MPIQIQEINDDNEAPECPLCMESLEVDDINFFPCVCGYQVCRFCWHRIRTDENGLCPACRTSYPENPAEFRPLTESDLQKIRQEKRQKEVQRRQKVNDGRRHLAAIRVLQKNLVFVVGLSQRLSDAEVLKRQDYFGKYGKIIKVVINTNTSYAGSQGPSSSAYVTYAKMEEALRAIQSVNNVHIDGRTLKASLGTTKYCSTYLKNQQCHKPDCMYLHELADEEASFTKEDMQVGKHQELEQRLMEQMMQKEVEAAANSEQTSSTDANTSSHHERGGSRLRRHSGTAGAPQSTVKIENSWIAGMNQNEQGLSARLSSSLEEKSNDVRNSPKRKTKKTSPRLSNKTQTAPSENCSDSNRVSSEPSLQTTTPPPVTITSTATTIHTDSRLLDTHKGETANTTTVTNSPVSAPTEQLEITASNQHAKSNTEETEPSVSEITKAADSLFISKSQEPFQPVQTYKPFQRFAQSNENVPAPTTNFSIQNILPSGGKSQSWIPEPSIQQLPDAIPIKSSHDWEAVFGFGKAEDKADDELDFDPWTVCNKGLADLMERESENKQHTSHSLQKSWNNHHSQQPPFHNPHPSTPFHQRADQTIPSRFGMKQATDFASTFSSHSAMNSAFSAPPQHFHRADSFPSQMASKSNLITSPTKKGWNDWQNGLRALLPSVNINFAMDSNNQGARNNPSSSVFPTGNMPGIGRAPLQNNVERGRPPLPLGYEDWSVGPNVPQSQSVLFPTQSTHPNRNMPSLFQNGFGLNQTAPDGYSSVAPPPGLGSTAFHSDPAIILSGNKAPVKLAQNPEDAPHWMRSLQTLTDTDSSMNPPPNFLSASEQSTSSFSAWPSLSNPGLPTVGPVSQPPPGFQSRLPYTNTTEFGMRHNLLENQS